jgi:hypothetical protein
LELQRNEIEYKLCYLFNRYDRKLICRRDEKRQLNLKVLQHAPCTIGILVDRPMGVGLSIGMPTTSASVRSTARTSTASADPETPATTTSVGPVHDVVAIFFGGPDDREAASFLAWIAPHKSINATLVRFLPQLQESQSKNWLSRSMSEFTQITERLTQFETDEQFITAYQERYIFVLVILYFLIMLHFIHVQELTTLISNFIAYCK